MYHAGMADFQTFSDVIGLWPSATELARDLGVKEVTARAWKARGIPAQYWADLVSAANNRNLTGVTFERLAALAAREAA
jgi:hypothetical protein